MNPVWVWPLTSAPLFPDESGFFGNKRMEDVHTGIDLYCNIGTEVRAVEDGEVVAIEWFTGQHVPTVDGVPSTWWNDTRIILVRGASGVVGYGECTPYADVQVGTQLKAGEKFAIVDTAVLKTFKGRPMVMLHLELYKTLQVQPDGSHTTWWKAGAEKPENLIDPSFYLLNAASSEDRGGQGSCFQMETYTGTYFRDFRAPCKDSKWWAMWGGDWQNPPTRAPIHAAIVVVYNDEGEVLLLQRHDEDREFPGGGWCFPGGKLNEGEKPLEAAVREVLEETGLEVKCFATLGVRESISPRGRLFEITIFAARVVGGVLKVFPTAEHQDYGRWIPSESPIPKNLAGDVTRWILGELSKNAKP